MTKREEALMARLIRIRKDVIKGYFALREVVKDNLCPHSSLDVQGMYQAQEDFLALNQTLMEVENAAKAAEAADTGK